MYYVEIQTRNGNTQLLHDPYAPEIDGRTVNSNVPRLYSGKVTLVLNAVSDFKFSILYGHPLFKDGAIRPYTTLVRVIDGRGNIIFRGRVLDHTYVMTSTGQLTKEFIAEDELAYLIDSKQRVWEYHNITPAEYLKIIIDNHNASVAGDEIDKTFRLGVVDVTNSTDNVYRYLAYDTSLNNIKDDLISSLGGYLSVTHQNGIRYLNYTKKSGEISNMSIELAVNLKSIESQYRPSELITRLIPLGAEVESVEFAIARLVASGIITDPDYWLSVYGDLPFLGELLINLSKFTYKEAGGIGNVATVQDAITFLAAAGAINSPGYWLEIYEAEAFNNLGYLLYQAGNRLDTEAGTSRFADASKPRLTIASVNNGKDYIDDKSGLITEFGIIEGIVKWDDVTNPSNLLAKGEAWLKAQTIPNSVSITALELSQIDESYESFKIGNYYKADNELLGINAEYQLIEQEIDVPDPVESTLTFGDRRITLSDYAVNIGGLG